MISKCQLYEDPIDVTLETPEMLRYVAVHYQ